MDQRIKTKFSDKIILVAELISIAILCFIFFKAQFLTSTIYGADGYLHIRMAEFLKEFGPKYDFHWTQFSTFLSHFSDKDFLFHVLLVPFTYFKDIFLGAKYASCTFFSLFILTMYLMLRKYGDKKFNIFFLVLLMSPYKFWIELLRPRPFALLFILSLFAVYSLIEKKYIWVMLSSFLLGIAHISGPYVLIYAITIEVNRYLSVKKFDLKNLFCVIGALLAAYLAHPNFPNNMYQFYLNAILVPLYASKSGVLELGAEFFPFNSREMLLNYFWLHVGIWFSLALLLYKKVEVSFKTRVFFILTMMFYVFAFLSKRYLTHALPFAILYFSSLSSDLEFRLKRFDIKFFLYPVLSLIVLVMLFAQYGAFRHSVVSNQYINTHYERFAEIMKNNIPKGERIFHANWSDSQYFIGLNPANDYYVTLDPVYMYQYDKKKYMLYRNIAFGKTSDPYYLIKKRFKTSYVYAGKNYFSGLILQMRSDKRFILIAEDYLGVIFKLVD